MRDPASRGELCAIAFDDPYKHPSGKVQQIRQGAYWKKRLGEDHLFDAVNDLLQGCLLRRGTVFPCHLAEAVKD